LSIPASDNVGNSWSVVALQEREVVVPELIISYEVLRSQLGEGAGPY